MACAAFPVYIGLFSLAGLIRGGALTRHYLLWPFTTVPTLVVVGLGVQTLDWVLVKYAGWHFGGIGLRVLNTYSTKLDGLGGLRMQR